jgi:hypothetical protein
MLEAERWSRVQGAFQAVAGLSREDQLTILQVVCLLCGIARVEECPKAKIAESGG